GRRPAGAGGTAEAVWQVRPDPASGQDAAGAVPAATAVATVLELLGGRPTRVIRPARLHALLGSFAAWVVGGEAQDGAGPLESGSQDDSSMVSAQPTPTAGGAARHTGSETAGSLRLLWDHGQRFVAAVVPGRGPPHLEEMAGTPP